MRPARRLDNAATFVEGVESRIGVGLQDALEVAQVVDWFSRRVLAWRLSITLETGFCLDAVEEALARHGKPEIFNTDQGSQFTSVAFTGLLQA